MSRFIPVLFLVTLFQSLSAQQNLPIVRANSKNVTIRDGLNYKSDYWVIFPEIKPDIYYLDIPRKTTHLVFVTDLDSISFTMHYGEIKDFIVLLNGEDSCYTRISANYPHLLMPNKPHQGNDTIPFTLKNNRIYLQGKLNNSELLNIQFDLGADAVNLNSKSANKVNIIFDQKGTLINSNGTNETRVSTNNVIGIQGLTWTGIEIYETQNMKNNEDLIIGNSFFLDRIYKIDYENSVLIIYEKSPEIEPEYVQQNMILDNGVRPVFQATFKIEDVHYTEWFLFDTGNTGNGIIGNNFLAKHNLSNKFTQIIGFGNKTIACLPPLTIADHTFLKGAITLEKQNKNNTNYKFGGLIGNKILNSFNVIIDNREGLLYLKYNTE